MRRRDFIWALGGGLAITAPLPVRAQPAMPTVGTMTPASSTTTLAVRFFLSAMREFGWEENRNYRVLSRWGDGQIDRFPALVDELIAQRVDVIVVFGEASIRAAQRATTTTPIVGMATDMVRTGRAASMARPGSNLTGVNVLASELDAKRLEILQEAAPAARRMGALALPDPGFDSEPELDVASRDLHLDLVVVKVRRIEELTHGLDVLESAHVDAVNVLASPLVAPTLPNIIERLNQARLPAIYEFPEYAERGGLLGYGASQNLASRHVARLVSKILKGARPQDLPIEQPNKFDLAVNLRTAKILGVTVPPSLLARADEVIE
jgi:putative tryptophan/tyrosine transport system substrate-binding protein